MVLESPFYGARKPAAQRGSKLLRVSDLLALGWATIAESIALLNWLREEGYGPLGGSGHCGGGRKGTAPWVWLGCWGGP